MTRVRILVEGDRDAGPSVDGVIDAVILGGHPDEYGLVDPVVVDYEQPEIFLLSKGDVWERDALIDALRSIADERHTGDPANLLDWDEQCPAHGPAGYAQAVLEVLGLQFVTPAPGSARDGETKGILTAVLQLVRMRGEITPGQFSVPRQVADNVGITVERARECLRQLETAGHVVLTVERRGVRGPVRILKVRAA